ncbi:MAG: porin [Proteobacteria bacterium]|nr:porin [Pseudomonadota bacterium]
MKTRRFILLSLVLPGIAYAGQVGGAPKVTIEGRMDTTWGLRHQNAPYDRMYSFTPGYTISPDLRDHAIVNDTKIDIKVNSPEDCEIAYGGLIRLNADTSTATSGEDSIADKTMFFVQSNRFGRIEGGNYPGAGAMFEMDISTYAKAGYGVEGFWLKWMNDVALVVLPGPTPVLLSGLSGFRYLASPNLPSNYSGLFYSDAPKLTYYTKPLDDLTIGVSYIPDLDSTGTVVGIAPLTGGPVDSQRFALGYRPTYRNIISGGAQYKKKLADWVFTMNVAGEIGSAKKYRNTDYIRDLRAYEVGGIVSYKTYSAGATYGNWGKTGTYRAQFPGTKQGASYWTLTASQQMEKLGYSLTYIHSRRAGGLEGVGSQLTNNSAPFFTPLQLPEFSDTSDNRMKALSFGAQYLVAPGLLPYTEVTGFRFSSAAETPSNHGYVWLTGIRMNF